MSHGVEVKKKRRYAAIWEQLKEIGACEIKCSPEDSVTMINMVRKEKLLDKDKQKGMVLKNDTNTTVESGVAVTYIKFRLVIDTSIRNL